VIVLTAVALAFAGGVAGYFVGRETGEGGATTVTVTGGSTTPQTGGNAAAGAAVFASAGCANCHTFTPAGSHGTVGPSLDGVTLSAADVQALVTSGRNAMPAFGDQLSEEEIQDVAAYVTQGGGGG
jgi:mono/diheme cytochrome c family protein